MQRVQNKTKIPAAAIVCIVLWLPGCREKISRTKATVQITRVPQADGAGGNKTEVIQGVTSGAVQGDRVVLYAQTGGWWVQPLEKQPFTELDRRFHWINGTHLGMKYAALLVGPNYTPAAHLDELPPVGGAVKAVAVAPGAASSPSPYISFSGYQWRTRAALSSRGGTLNRYAAANAWTDAKGALHLEITGSSKDWTCAEVTLVQSLGYGTYSFELRDVSKLEPSTVFAFFTYDYAGGDKNHREANIEVSRWGDASIKNGQYVVQPFHVPANVTRFVIPPGPNVHSLEWTPGRMMFRSANLAGKVFSQQLFASGTPEPGLESARMAFYVFNHGPYKQKRPAEVVVESFKFLP